MERKKPSVLPRRVLLAAALLVTMAGAAGGMLLLRDDAPPEEPPAEPALTITRPAAAPAAPAAAPAPPPKAAPVSRPVEIIAEEPAEPEPPRLVVCPLEGEVVAAFSADELAYSPTLEDWRTHEAVDIAAEAGSAVLAAADGTVEDVREDALLGTTVVIAQNDGCETVYASLSAEPEVIQGETVTAGQVLGTVGTTASAEADQGPHLHFAVSRDGEPMDPEVYLHG